MKIWYIIHIFDQYQMNLEIHLWNQIDSSQKIIHLSEVKNVKLFPTEQK